MLLLSSLLLMSSWSVLLTSGQTMTTVPQNLTVFEEQPRGAVIGQISVTSATPPYTVYHAGRQDSRRIVVSRSGHVTVGERLDREEQSLYRLIAHSSNNVDVELYIYVLDINDNSPLFTPPAVNLSISESASIGSTFTLGQVTDLDLAQFSVQRCDLVSGNVGGAFRLVTSRGPGNGLSVQLVLNATLNFQSVPFYDLVIRSVDGGQPPRSSDLPVRISVIDMNDNKPQFNQSIYSVTIPDNTPVGKTIFRVFATDRDSGRNGRISYSLDRHQGSQSSDFEVDSTTGEISVRNPLNFTVRQSYVIVVVAEDHGRSPLQASTVVTVDIVRFVTSEPLVNVVFLSDDGSPKIPKSAVLGELVAYVSVTDPDTPVPDPSKVNVTLKGGGGYFGLRRTGATIYLMVVSTSLDSAAASYRLTIIAEINSTTLRSSVVNFTLTVITSSNSTTPTFAQPSYYAEIQQTVPPGTSVVRVAVVGGPSDARYVYRIRGRSGSRSDWFHVDRRSGLMTTSVTFSCLTVGDYRLNVVARNSTVRPRVVLTTSVTVRVTSVNRHSPVFHAGFYSEDVPDDTAVSTCLLRVRASDPGCSYTERGDSADGTPLVYTTTATSLPVTVRRDTGDVCLSAALNYDTTDMYEFNVTATDPDGYSAVTAVQLRVQPANTDRPVFSSATYVTYLHVNMSVGDFVVAVAATGVRRYGNRPTYHITAGNRGSVFTIEPHTGVVRLKRRLLSQRLHYNLTVMALSHSGLVSRPHATVDITVHDASLSDTSGGRRRPQFTERLYQMSVSEDVLSGASVGTVSVTQLLSVRYTLLTGGRPFIINSLSGQLLTSGQLDHDTESTYLLTVRAELLTDSSLFSLTQVNVSVLDVNDNDPVFSTIESHVSFREDAPVGTLVYVARARDADSGINSILQYTLSGGDDLFEVDSTSGRITIRSSLDRETFAEHRIIVSATDSGTPARSASMRLVVTVLDVNDHRPLFNSDGYSFRVLYPVPLGAVIGSVGANDSDATLENSRLTYYLHNGRLTDIFDIRSPSGEIRTKVVLGHDRARRYLLEVVAADGGVPALSATATVLVSLYDENRDGVLPTFTQSRYVFNVTENQPAESRVGIVTSRGVDDPQYFLLSSYSYFSVVPASGEILSRRLLDREEIDSHRFEVGVRGHGRVTDPVPLATVSVTVRVLDVNDNVPQFHEVSPRVVHVGHNIAAGSSVAQMLAIDADDGRNGDVVYQLATDNNHHFWRYFSIDSGSGLITATQPLGLTSPPYFTLKVVAVDTGDPPRSSVPHVLEVYVDDTPTTVPVSSSVSFSVADNVDVGTVLGPVEQPMTTGYYCIVHGNTFGSFGVNHTSGVLYVALPLSYDDCPTYSVQVEVVGAKGVLRYIVVNVSVTNAEVGVPAFETELLPVEVRENVPIGIFVARMAASYDGGKTDLEYSIVSETPNNGSLGVRLFSVESRTGYVRTAASIDREAVQQITVVVAATTTSPRRRRSTATLVVTVTDVNDHSPVFTDTETSVRVSEDVAEGFLVATVVARDADVGDNGRVTYCIVSGNEKGHFAIDGDSGVVSVIRSLDRESVSVYHLNITATDSGAPAMTSQTTLNIHVDDVNDNAPVFLQRVYRADVDEEQDAPVAVVTVSATDFDDPTTANTALTYVIADGDADNKFTVNATTGLISTTSRLDRESRHSWIVTVYVHNAGLPALYDMATVHVTVHDVNDNAPVFAKTSDGWTLNLPENANMAAVHTVEAYDADVDDNARISYFISGGNTDGRFYLDESSGRLSCSPLDRELVPAYNLSITAVDHAPGGGARSSTTYLLVRVMDDNDNDPVFERSAYRGSVSEAARNGTTVLTVSASDLDDGLNGNISYALSNSTQGMFKVDSNTGVITTAGRLDRETMSSYSFDAVATDSCLYGPRSQTVRVDITVLDVNDNAPRFASNIYSADISLDWPVGDRVSTVSAIDDDIGLNARLTYSLADSDDSYFQIDTTSGMLTTRRLLDPSAIGTHSLRVSATDSGKPALTATCMVVVQVGMSTPPTQQLRFVNQTYTVSVAEHSARGTVLVTVLARVTNDTVPVIYSLADGDGIFDMDHNSGVITVSNSDLLDYESSRRHRLIVIATTSHNNVYDYATVWINVVDVNDNVPEFYQERYQSAVWENNRPHTFVLQVEARDADSGTFGEVLYEISSGNSQSAFVIDPPRTGIIKTTVPLDREIQDLYRLEVRAYNPGARHKYSVAVVRIQVVDSNDNVPFFPTYSPLFIHEGEQAGKMLLRVTANDIDIQPVLTYDLLTLTDMFTVDKYSGKLSLTGKLDYETRTAYNLTVMVSDQLHNTTTSVLVNIIDDNDNAPVFTQSSYEVSVAELTGAGVNVLTVSATDSDSADNGRVTYSMLPLDSFNISATTGAIYTTRQLVFNANQPAVHLVVTATDHGTPVRQSTAITVQITVEDINDHAPVFTLASYSMSVSEDETVGATLLRLTATDADFTHDNTELEFNIISSRTRRTGDDDEDDDEVEEEEDGRGWFTVTESTGELILVSALDRETTDRYELTVTASDRGQPSLTTTTTVTVTVLDVNDESPTFTSSQYNVTLTEDTPVSSRPVLTVLAVDRDSGLAGHVTYSIASGDGTDKFHVDADSGALSVISPLDYETKTSYSLVVSAVDGGPPPVHVDHCEVYVSVLDVNEFTPTFPTRFFFTETVPENQPVGTFVFTAKASDKDAGPFGVIHYQMEPYSVADVGAFTIDEVTGDVTTGLVFNASATYLSFQYRITAADAGGLKSTVGAIVKVVPQMRQALQFTQTFYRFEVPGDAKVGDVIGRVWVRLPADSSGSVLYFLRPLNEHFDVNQTSGVIYVIKDLSEWSEKRRRRRGSPVLRQRRSLVPVELHVVAQSGHFEAEATVQLAINRTLCCGAARTETNRDPGLGTPLILVIVLLSLAIIIAGIITIICLHRRRTKTPLGMDHAGSTGAESSSLETFDVPLPPPPAYGEDAVRRRRYHGMCPTMDASEYDDDYAGDSSGRGSASAEKPVQSAADHEIQMINSGGSARGACPRRLVQPDSGIQPDHDDAGSTGSAGRRQNLAAATSVDSMHQFYDEGGGEASVGLSEDLSLSSPCFDQPVIDADQLLLIAANSRYSAADYLLNWKPEYQPLADVFAEIARLPDDTDSRRPVAKTCPTHIVPQPTVNHRLGSASTPHSGARPPPIITAAPPRAVRVTMPTDNDSVTSSIRSSTSSNRVQPSSSVWTCQQASFSRHEPTSRDDTCSVSYNTPGQAVNQPLAPAARTSLRSSDREIQI